MVGSHISGVAAVVAACAALASTPAAEAQSIVRTRGVELGARFTAGGFVQLGEAGWTPESLSPGFGFDVQAGYRALPALSVGAHYQQQHLGSGQSVLDAELQFTITSRQFGVYGRVYPLRGPSGRFEPWLGVGLDYGRFSTEGTRNYVAEGAPHVNRGAIVFEAIAIPVGVGFDVAIVPGLVVGPSFTLSPWFPVEACWSYQNHVARGTTCESNEPGLFAGSGWNVQWFGGVGARYTFGR